MAWNFLEVAGDGGVLVVCGCGLAIELKSKEDEGDEGQDAGESISLHGNIIHEVK